MRYPSQSPKGADLAVLRDAAKNTNSRLLVAFAGRLPHSVSGSGFTLLGRLGNERPRKCFALEHSSRVGR